MEKYMTSPVTSTSVATKGAEEVAGSAPSLFSKQGKHGPGNGAPEHHAEKGEAN